MAAQKSALINVMTAAAQKAGRKLVRDFGEVENLQVSQKGPADFVSNADHAAEKILLKELQKARPTYGLLMEERGVVEGSDTSNTWVVDPLDGTTNFLHGIPHFAVSIGLMRDGDYYAGVIYSPVHDEMYWAEKGQGAFLNNKRLRVSARKEMREGLFATGIPYMEAKGRDHDLFLKQLPLIMDASSGVRRFGAAALDLAYVAAGRYDGFWEQGLNAWDIAAGIAIVREAGGFVSDFDGKAAITESGTIVAANPSLHAPLVAALKEAVA